MPVLSNTQAAGIAGNAQKIAGAACTVPAIAETSIGILKNQLASLKEKKAIVASLKSSAWETLRTTGVIAGGVLGEALLNEIEKETDKVSRVKAGVEMALNLIANADTEFRLAVAQVIVDRMVDKVNFIRSQMKKIQVELDDVRALVDRIASLIYAMGEGSVNDIRNAKRRSVYADHYIQSSIFALENKGHIYQRDIEKAMDELRIAIRYLSNKQFGSANFSENGKFNFNMILSPEMQVLFEMFEKAFSGIGQLLKYKEDISLAYSSVLLYRTWLLNMDDNINIVQAGATVGLYGKSLSKTHSELQLMIENMEAFLLQHNQPIPTIQFRKNEYLFKIKSIMSFVQATLKGNALSDASLDRLQAYRRLRTHLEESPFYDPEGGARWIGDLQVKLAQVVASAGKLLSFNRGSLDSYRVILNQTRDAMNQIYLQTAISLQRLGEFNSYFSLLLDQVVFILESLGMENADEKIASGEIISFVKMGADAGLAIVTTAECVQEQVKNFNIFNPEDTRKAQTLIEANDQKDAVELTKSIENSVNPYQSLADYERGLGDEEKQLEETINRYGDTLL